MSRSDPPAPRPAPPLRSPILSIDRGETDSPVQVDTHAHAEPTLLWASTATATAIIASRDWMISAGYGLWIPGGVEHGAAVLNAGEMSIITFAPEHCPITWTEPTGVAVGPLLRELISHLFRVGPQDPSRPRAEALMFDLLTPLPTHDIHAGVARQAPAPCRRRAG